MYKSIKKGLQLTEKQIEGVRKSGRVNTTLLDFISDKLYVGMTTLEIDSLIYSETIRIGGVPATLNYNGYPRSLCTSLNDQVCHGIPAPNEILKSGDIINIDIATNYKGYYSDSARVFGIGEISNSSKRLIEVSRKCIDVGLKQVKPWTSMKSIGLAVSDYAVQNGYSIASGIGGHGIGLKFHEEPYVSYENPGTNMQIVPGMIFTIEPAVNQGSSNIFEDANNGWTIYTVDGENSAQWEVTVLVTNDGYEILAYWFIKKSILKYFAISLERATFELLRSCSFTMSLMLKYSRIIK